MRYKKKWGQADSLMHGTVEKEKRVHTMELLGSKLRSPNRNDGGLQGPRLKGVKMHYIPQKINPVQ